jgi:hypothetical protein
MTPEQHNKYLGLAHIGYVLLHTLFGIGLAVMMIAISSTAASSPRDPQPPRGFFFMLAAFVLVMTVGWTIPSMIAAFALLKKKRWAKMASIVAGVFAAAQLPFGTAVSVYTFWFMFSPPGRLLYDSSPKSLTGGTPDDRFRIDQEKVHEYFPPAAPPDWR